MDQQLSSGEGSKEEEWVVVARRGRWWTVTVKEAGRWELYSTALYSTVLYCTVL